MEFDIPPSEDARLKDLEHYSILDTDPEEAFDRITKLAQRIFDVPISLVTLIDASRQWFKSRRGLGVEETPRDIAFCAHTILDHRVMVVPDAMQDERFKHNPLVLNDPNIRFYAGALITTPDGHNIGSLAVIDTEPRAPLTEEESTILTDLAALVVDELELRSASLRLKQGMVERERSAEVAQESNRAKSEFLSRMSHELRTPLTAILGFGQLLEMSDLAPADADAVRHILTAGNHLLALINDVLDISRVEAGRLPLSLEPVDIGPLVREVFTLSKPLANQRRVSLERPSESGTIVVKADNQRLKQVLLNLVNNAIKYNHEGGSVRLSYYIEERRVRIAITDRGRGIRAEKLPKLFQPFERLGLDQSDIEGTGLGLALSKQLVEAMGGVIGVESNVEEGSTFWIRLPLEAVSDRPELVTDKQDAAVSSIYSNEKRYTLLYVEDNLSNLTLLKAILSYRTDLEILTAMRGNLGLDLAVGHTPDLILLDLNLPEMSGDEILRELRRNPNTRKIPVVILSADATPAQTRRLLSEGANAYLTKPFDIKKIRETVDSFLDATTLRS